jgi:hypothetical protein
VLLVLGVDPGILLNKKQQSSSCVSVVQILDMGFVICHRSENIY